MKGKVIYLAINRLSVSYLPELPSKILTRQRFAWTWDAGDKDSLRQSLSDGISALRAHGLESGGA